MAYALEVGLLCHPTNAVPSSQQAKYHGFILNASGALTLVEVAGCGGCWHSGVARRCYVLFCPAP